MEPWIKALPTSRVAYPSAPHDRFKYWFWRLYTPLHPFVRDASYRIGIGQLILRRIVPEVRHTGRQDFLIGTMRPERSVREFVSFLISQGFGNQFVAWRDVDELVSLRQTVGFKHQYHLRIFKDGEVRGHYEFTPEYHPVLHLVRIGFEEKTAEFKTLLQKWVEPTSENA